MKTLKKMAFTGLMLLTTTLSFGQNQKPDSTLTPEERATKRTEKMKEELGLTSEQTTKIYAINLEHILAMDKLREEQKALREKMKAEKESTRQKIKAVLTPEQNVLFDQKAEDHKKKQEERHKDCNH